MTAQGHCWRDGEEQTAFSTPTAPLHLLTPWRVAGRWRSVVRCWSGRMLSPPTASPQVMDPAEGVRVLVKPSWADARHSHSCSAPSYTGAVSIPAQQALEPRQLLINRLE